MSDDMESVTEEERREAVKTQVRRVFGGEADQMIDYRDTLWTREHFTVCHDTTMLIVFIEHHCQHL